MAKKLPLYLELLQHPSIAIVSQVIKIVLRNAMTLTKLHFRYNSDALGYITSIDSFYQMLTNRNKVKATGAF